MLMHAAEDAVDSPSVECDKDEDEVWDSVFAEGEDSCGFSWP